MLTAHNSQRHTINSTSDFFALINSYLGMYKLEDLEYNYVINKFLKIHILLTSTPDDVLTFNLSKTKAKVIF